VDHTDSLSPAAEADLALVIPREELKSRVDARDPHLVLVDVLGPDSYQIAHIPGAVNIPYATMSEQVVRAALADTGADIVMYCGGDT
jgi:rhodanese-related sulfurtransferase